MAWNSFDRFKIASFDKKLDLTEAGGDTTDDLNFAALNFNVMIGFDAPLEARIGRFDFNLISFNATGAVQDMQPLSTYPCPSDYAGVKYAERELGRKVHGTDFELTCI